MLSEVPSGWQQRPLGDLFVRVNRKNRAGVTRVLTASGEHGLIDQAVFFNKTVAGADLSTYLHVKRGEFAYNRSAMNGYPVGAVKRLDRYDEGVVSSLYLCFAARDDAPVCADFAAHVFNSATLEAELRPIVKVGARAHGLLNVAADDFMGIRFPLPPLPEQKKIAAILSSVDEAIQATQAVIDQTRRVKEGLLQDLLTRGIGHTRFKQTEIGEIPEGWEVRPLQDVCRANITYGIVQCGPHVDGGVPYIRVSDMEHAELQIEGMLRTAPEIAARFARSTVEVGDVVYALRGKIGEVRLVRADVAGANLTQGTARVAPASTVQPEFLLWAMRSPATMKQGDVAAKGSTFREITLDGLRKIRVPVPPLAEQAEIVERLRAAEAALAAAEASIAAHRRLKSGLLTDLLTGKVRVAP